MTRAQLAAEYNRCSVFCLPSVQEGFGIVLLEAMAAGKPIVAARAAAIPEVAPFATLVEPDNAEALAAGLATAAYDARSFTWVDRFDAGKVGLAFVSAVAPSVAAIAAL